MNLVQYNLAKVVKAPIISEKSTLAAEKNRRFVFEVQKNATKIQIRNAVEMMFGVKVDSVQVLNVKGKQKRFSGRLGQRSDWKKAYVKLQLGYDINFSAP